MSALFWFFSGHKGSGPELESGSEADVSTDAWMWSSSDTIMWNTSTEMDY